MSIRDFIFDLLEMGATVNKCRENVRYQIVFNGRKYEALMGWNGQSGWFIGQTDKFTSNGKWINHPEPIENFNKL